MWSTRAFAGAACAIVRAWSCRDARACGCDCGVMRTRVASACGAGRAPGCRSEHHGASAPAHMFPVDHRHNNMHIPVTHSPQTITQSLTHEPAVDAPWVILRAATHSHLVVAAANVMWALACATCRCTHLPRDGTRERAARWLCPQPRHAMSAATAARHRSKADAKKGPLAWRTYNVTYTYNVGYVHIHIRTVPHRPLSVWEPKVGLREDWCCEDTVLARVQAHGRPDRTSVPAHTPGGYGHARTDACAMQTPSSSSLPSRRAHSAALTAPARAP